MGTVFEIGQVDWFDEVKGFGFIKQTGQEDAFVHSSYAAPGALKAGVWVLFQRRQTKKGSSAINVRQFGDDPATVQALFPALNQFSTEAVFMHKNEELTKSLLIWQKDNLTADAEGTLYEAAYKLLVSCRKHLPDYAAELSVSFLPVLSPSEQWYWWQSYCAPQDITDAAVAYFESVADIHYGDNKQPLTWLQIDDGSAGGVLLNRLGPLYFDSFFRRFWSRQRVEESLANDGGELIKTHWYHVDDRTWTVPAQYRLTSKRGFMLRYFAELAVEGVAELLWQYESVVVPEWRFLKQYWELFEEEHLWELLHHDLPGINSFALHGCFNKIGRIETEAEYKQVVALLRQCAASLELELRSEATNLAEASLPVPVLLRLWLDGHLPGLDLAVALGTLPTPVLRAHAQGTAAGLRNPAAKILLSRAAAEDGKAGRQAGVRELLTVRSFLLDNDFEELLFVYPDASDIWLAGTSWLRGGIQQSSLPLLCEWLAALDALEDEQFWKPLHQANGDAQAELFRYVLQIDGNRLLLLTQNFLLQWFKHLPRECRDDMACAIATGLRKEVVLNLWLEGIADYYSFAQFYLLVAALEPPKQFLFLRKTFGLMAEGKISLTVQELENIPRRSIDDDNPTGRQLDYSIDLALLVLLSLSQGGTLPSEGGIIEVVCRYIKEDTKALILVGKELFASCPGRSELEKTRAPDKDIVRARVGGEEFPASTDKKIVFLKDIPMDVVNNAIELFGDLWPVSWIVTPSYTYQPGTNNPKLKPNGIELCEGRLAHKEDDESQLPLWWCCNRPCFKPNQGERAVEDWRRFSLLDFISILGLKYDADSYYVFVGMINRVNRLLARLQCRCCGRILRPVGQSDFNFHRVNRFKCTNRVCEEQEQEVYLSHCLNGHCMTVIDSRDSKRCSYRTEGRPDRQGMYICDYCGGCCSKQSLVRRKENLEKTYRPEMLASHAQYKLITENLANRLYHWERMRIFCYKCTNPMQQRHPQANYTCPDCNVEYRWDMAHIEVARRKNKVEVDA